MDELAQDQDTLSVLTDYQKVLAESLSPGRNAGAQPTEPVPGDDEQQTTDLIKDNVRMKDFVATQLDQMQKNEWIIRYKGKDVFRVRKNLEQVVAKVQQFSGLIDSAVKHLPSPAAPAWAGICVVMNLITADSEERTKAIDGLDKISSIVARTEVAEKGYFASGAKDEMFEKTMVALYRSLITFYSRAACYFWDDSLVRFMRNTVRADDWTGILKEIELKDVQAHKFATTLSLGGIAEDVRAVKDSVTDNQKRQHVNEVLNWTSTVNVGAQHTYAFSNLGEKYKSSGRWLFDHESFQNWDRLPNGHLWLQGNVGTGKTSLVAILIEELKAKSTCPNLAWFYFSVASSGSDETANSKKQDNVAVLRSLIAQLAFVSDLEVAAELELAFEGSRKMGTQGTELNIDEAQELLLKIIESRDSTTMILDALDEHPKYAEFLAIIEDLQSKTQRLRFFISSQPHVPIAEYLETISLVKITNKVNSGDMAAFVEEEIRFFEKVRKLDKPLGVEFKERVKARLVKHSRGMYVCLCFFYLCYLTDY